MKRTLAAIAVFTQILAVVQAKAQAVPVYSDDWSTHNTTVWNDGGGYFWNTNAENYLLSTFGGGFATRGDATPGVGSAGLNSAVGYGELNVIGSQPFPKILGMNFNIGAGADYWHSQQAILRLDFASIGAARYQFLWNNTSSTQSFTIPGGWSGTVGPHSRAIVTNWNFAGAMWGATTNGTAVNSGDPAIRFGFWGNVTNHTAVVDDLKIYDTLQVIPPLPGPGAYVVYDNFTATNLDPVVWNDGGGFFLDTNAQNVLLSTFGGGFGKKGDGSGAAGLNSAVGYASFTVAEAVGTFNPIGGNFLIGNNTNANVANALVNVPLVNGGEGTYELLWNNTGSSNSFAMPISGWSGSIGPHSSVWIVDGKTADATWGSTTNATFVNAGDPANRFSFWIGSAIENALIDNVRIADTLTPGAAVPAPTLQISRSGSDVILNWSESGFKLQHQSATLSTGLGTNWTDYFLPAGTNPPVTVSASSDAEFFRLTEQ